MKNGKFYLLLAAFVLLLTSCASYTSNTTEPEQTYEDFVASVTAAAQTTLPLQKEPEDAQKQPEQIRSTPSVKPTPDPTPYPSSDEDSPIDIDAEGDIAEIEPSPEYPMNKVFRLSEYEEALYNDYLCSLDILSLAGQEPKTVGKIFIQLALNEELDACYELHTKDEDLPAKDQYIEEGGVLLSSIDAVTRKSFANKVFGDVDDAEFVKQTETTGYIEYRDQTGHVRKFDFIKNEDNVWQIVFFRF